MPFPKILLLLVCTFSIAVYASPVQEKKPAPKTVQTDTTGAEDKFDAFLEHLIGTIQTNIEHTVNKNDSKESVLDDQFESSDSLEIVAGDMLVSGSEIVDHDVYVQDGTLTVEGILRGNASVLRGSIVVKDGGRITGNAHAIGGSVLREHNGVVDGEIRESSSDRGGFIQRRFTHASSYTFAPRWLHENLYSDNVDVRYNRVEGVYLGLASDKKFYWDGHRIISGYGSLGYGFLTHRWRGQLGLDRQFAFGRSIVEFGVEGHSLTDTKDDWIIGQCENTAAAFFLREDYRDYYQRAGFSAHTAWYTKALGLSTMVNAEYRYDEYESLYKRANWSLFKNADGFRDNPLVNEGILRSIVITGGVSTVERRRRSDVGWNAYLQAEFGGRSMGGDGNFSKAVVDVRRYQPLSKYDNLSVRVRVGSLEGDALVQKSFELGGVNTLPAFGFKEFSGNRMMLANIEYALNGSVFDDVSFWPGFLTLMVFADAGDAHTVDTRKNVTDGFTDFSAHNLKSDLGFALGWHDGTARLGWAWRTDKSAPPMVFVRLSKPF
jgi:hypothetical protein